jgi:segregation and condensation protein A
MATTTPPDSGQGTVDPAKGAAVEAPQWRTAAAEGRGDFESGLERFPVTLEVFQGPLDLLLHLDYIGLMEEMQLDVAGDFLVMAATLIHIKSRSLLPRPAPEQEDPEEDPREALVRRLVEHQKFKAAAELLHDKETVRSAQWARPDERIAALAGEGLDKEPELEVDLFSLMTAFKAVVDRAKQRPQVYLPMEQMSIEQRIEQLMRRLEGVEAMGFEDLFEDVARRGDLIVTFLAVLEMIRLKVLRVFQSGTGGPIRVYKRDRPAEAPRPIEYHEPGRPQGTPEPQS